MRWIASFRNVRKAGAPAIALGAGLVLLAGCQNMVADMNNQIPAPTFDQGAGQQAAAGGQGTCSNAANVWTGRMTALPNNSGNGGAGTGQSMVSCFPTRQACHNWLLAASGAANGVIVEDRCTLSSRASGAS